ncbi:polyprenyl synthetase family protein [Streptomyces bauhiniae]|uniref:polyprenyl synthetase family protein n=1 Tax=Streptomyces bauhiniae TaxID=2340725 RepID=UPI00331728FA
MPVEAVETLQKFLHAGGKRLPPWVCACGWWAGGGPGVSTPLVRVAASLELFHAFALIHDDVMDESTIRRGQPTVHRALAALRSASPRRGTAARFGTAAAILVGDLALAWSDDILYTCGAPAKTLVRVLSLADVMRTELMHGQYLDLLSTGTPSADIEGALRVARYKTAKYTIERPLHLGAVLAGGGPGLLDELSAFAVPIGEAYQLRDDLLDIFGDPRRTGKPVLGDVREGKHTALLAWALAQANPRQHSLLTELAGAPGLDDLGAERVREVLTSTGARAHIEHLIEVRREQAHEALARVSLPPAATSALTELADAVTTAPADPARPTP